jgi:hypothetical protein
MNFTNTGGVNAHEIHSTTAIGIRDGRTLVSSKETIPVLGPTTPRPDFIYPFELSPEEYESLIQTRIYIVAEGSFDYEDGFKTQPTVTFCRAYIWGPKFGRWEGDCKDATTTIHLARSIAK